MGNKNITEINLAHYRDIALYSEVGPGLSMFLTHNI